MKPAWSGVGERPHHRRVRPVSSGPRRNRRPWLVVLGVGVGILASVSALTVGSFVIGSFGSIPNQASAGGIPNAPPGVTFVKAEAALVNATTTPAAGACTAANNGTYASPVTLANNTVSAICMNTAVGGFASADTMFVLIILWNGAANATKFQLQVSIDVTPASHDASLLSFVATPSGVIANEQVVYALDLTQAGDTSVTSFSALVTQL
jgi:hypothetical protein